MIELKLPRTRNLIARERDAIDTAIADIVGWDEAARLIRISEELPRDENRLDPGLSGTERITLLTETEEGRAKLAALTWETIDP